MLQQAVPSLLEGEGEGRNRGEERERRDLCAENGLKERWGEIAWCESCLETALTHVAHQQGRKRGGCILEEGAENRTGKLLSSLRLATESLLQWQTYECLERQQKDCYTATEAGSDSPVL